MIYTKHKEAFEQISSVFHNDLTKILQFEKTLTSGLTNSEQKTKSNYLIEYGKKEFIILQNFILDDMLLT